MSLADDSVQPVGALVPPGAVPPVVEADTMTYSEFNAWIAMTAPYGVTIAMDARTVATGDAEAVTARRHQVSVTVRPVAEIH